MHDFKGDFYGHDLKVVILGYIRPELDYVSRGESNTTRVLYLVPTLTALLTEALIEDIETDKRVALKSLARPGYQKFQTDPFFTHDASASPRL